MYLSPLQPLPHTANSVLLCYPGTRAGASNVSGDGKGKDVVGRKVPKGARERQRRVRLLADIHVFLVLILILFNRATTDGVFGGEGADGAAVPPHRAVKTEAKSNSPIFGDICVLLINERAQVLPKRGISLRFGSRQRLGETHLDTRD